MWRIQAFRSPVQWTRLTWAWALSAEANLLQWMLMPPLILEAESPPFDPFEQVMPEPNAPKRRSTAARVENSGMEITRG